MKINVIGDIHGRTNWKDIVIDDGINVFVGDYFDPYDRISSNDLASNFIEICEFKMKHPETILLYGNHDFHYVVPAYGGTTTRYDSHNSGLYKELLDENEDLFQGVAYAPDRKHIITHAGITRPWLDKYLDTDDFTGIWLPDGSKVPTTSEVERFINDLWWNSKNHDIHDDRYEFSFRENCDFWDTYGETPTQSPIWIRPSALVENNAYRDTEVVQIVGHTQVNNVVDFSDTYDKIRGKEVRLGIVLVDCLGQNTESYTFESKN